MVMSGAGASLLCVRLVLLMKGASTSRVRFGLKPTGRWVVCAFALVAASASGQGGAEQAWTHSHGVSRDEFTDRVTGAYHHVTAQTGWDKWIKRPVPVDVSIDMGCSLPLPEGSEVIEEVASVTPELTLTYRTPMGNRWETFAELMSIRRPASPPVVWFTWLDVRVDSKPPMRLDAVAIYGSVTYRAPATESALVGYMEDGRTMRVRVAGIPEVRRLRIAGAGEAYARVESACAELPMTLDRPTPSAP